MREQKRKVTCNDRKCGKIILSAKEPKRPGEDFHRDRRQEFQVYDVPKDDYRGAEMDHFKVVVNDIVVTDTDIQKLRQKAQEIYTNISEAEYERVLVVKTMGYKHRNHQNPGDEFGLEWEEGWRVAKLDAVFDVTRTILLDVENWDEREEPYEAERHGGIIVGTTRGHRGYQEHKTAVIPWTAEREAMLKKAVEDIGKIKEHMNEVLLAPEAFANLLDAKSGLFLEAPKE